MPRWKIGEAGDSFSGLEADFVPMCPFCNLPMEAVALKLLNFPLNEQAWWKKGEKNAYAIDVETWCSSCGFWQPFGIACPKTHWEEVKKKTEKLHGESKSSEVDTQRKHISRA